MTGTAPDDYDPEAVPISHAATVMVVDDRGPGHADLHVLMVHRTARVIFAPDMWVFPGGRVDPDDHLEDFDTLCRGLSDEQASTVLGVERGGLAWWIAAARETLEESGLFLGSTSDTATIAEIRRQVLQDENLFADVLLARGTDPGRHPHRGGGPLHHPARAAPAVRRPVLRGPGPGRAGPEPRRGRDRQLRLDPTPRRPSTAGRRATWR